MSVFSRSQPKGRTIQIPTTKAELPTKAELRTMIARWQAVRHSKGAQDRIEAEILAGQIKLYAPHAFGAF